MFFILVGFKFLIKCVEVFWCFEIKKGVLELNIERCLRGDVVVVVVLGNFYV